MIDLLRTGQPGNVMRTAYDTAWVARLGSIDLEMSNQSLSWINEHQLPDGSWGAAEPMYYHDRVISTLAAMTALCQRGRRNSDRKQIDMGLAALERIAGGATRGLMADPNGATAGFEMIVPTLVAEAERLGILKRQGDSILGRLSKLRAAKLTRMNGRIINRSLAMVFSAEMAGPDYCNLLNLDQLQEENGSVAFNPSTTAYYALHVRPGDPAALNYLHRVVDEDGGAPIASPFDVYERAWVLWNVALAGGAGSELSSHCRPHLEILKKAWLPGRGVGFGSGYAIQDGDDTSLVSAVMCTFGEAVDLDALYNYQEADHFRCFDLEVNPSVSTNVHFLDVFRRLAFPREHPSVQQLLSYLRASRVDNHFWFDKWHASPYYTASHVVIASAAYDPDLAFDVVDWIVKTQNADGSWGYFSATAEETAYALQALCVWAKDGGKTYKTQIQRGATWLEDHSQPPFPALWIAKSLYYSEWVVRAEILSALILTEQI